MIFNLIFVICLRMGVAGVAAATVISQMISGLLILRCLTLLDGCCRLRLKGLKLFRDKTLLIMRIGFPAGLQGMVFSLSNVLIQSSVNSFGPIAMSFISQNFGAGKQERITKVLFLCLGMVTTVGLVMGFGAYFAGTPLLSIYSSDSEVIHYGLLRLSVICTAYCLCGIMDTMVGALRGIGYSFMPMVVSLLGACGLRIIWIFTIFRWNRSLLTLYISYPVTWIITALVHMICYGIVRKKQLRSLAKC